MSKKLNTYLNQVGKNCFQLILDNFSNIVYKAKLSISDRSSLEGSNSLRIPVPGPHEKFIKLEDLKLDVVSSKNFNKKSKYAILVLEELVKLTPPRGSGFAKYKRAIPSLSEEQFLEIQILRNYGEIIFYERCPDFTAPVEGDYELMELGFRTWFVKKLMNVDTVKPFKYGKHPSVTRVLDEMHKDFDRIARKKGIVYAAENPLDVVRLYMD